MASKILNLSPEQITLSDQRKRQKIHAQTLAPKLIDLDKGQILPRTWVALPEMVKPRQKVKIMTWNLLAQCLVRKSTKSVRLVIVLYNRTIALFASTCTRRELFPTSNCLKAHQREHMLFNEITSYEADILCLQEVDRLERLLPVLEDAGYSHVYAAGPRKKHGCLIAYRSDKYFVSKQHSICYDDQDVRESDERSSRGVSFRTKNIASLVALKLHGSEEAGLIVATSHFFWHPRYTYERARQAVIILRETVKFRDQTNNYWPCIIAGGGPSSFYVYRQHHLFVVTDFNFAPNDPAYSLLVGDPVLSSQEELLASSRVVHVTIDPDQTEDAATKTTTDEDEGAQQDPDRVITRARPATFEDGLLSTAELSDLAASYGPLRSCYDEGQKIYKASHLIPTYGDRVPIEGDRRGRFEPEWTSYTHYWKTVLDYIFVLDPPSRSSQITGFLKPHTTESLQPGLPQTSVCGSDHVSLVCEICW